MTTEQFQKSQRPGKHERHLIRRANCPLFAQHNQTLISDDLEKAQRRDHDELIAFINHLRSLVSRAMNFSQKEESEVIIKLKEELDKGYEEACRLADDQSDNKAAILALLDVIMSTISKNAAGDTLAFKEMGKERQARATHFALLENPLVADLIDPESPIAEDELVATLFSTTPEIMESVLVLFDSAQLKEIQQAAGVLLKELNLVSEYEKHQAIIKKSLAEIQLSTLTNSPVDSMEN